MVIDINCFTMLNTLLVDRKPMINVIPLKCKAELVNEQLAQIFGITIVGQNKYLAIPICLCRTVNVLSTTNG